MVIIYRENVGYFNTYVYFYSMPDVCMLSFACFLTSHDTEFSFMKLLPALRKTVIQDNFYRYYQKPVQTFLAVVALVATAVYLPILVMPMLIVALASFVANVFFNMGKTSPEQIAFQSSYVSKMTQEMADLRRNSSTLTSEIYHLKQAVAQQDTTTSRSDFTVRTLRKNNSELTVQVAARVAELEAMLVSPTTLSSGTERLKQQVDEQNVDVRVASPAANSMFSDRASKTPSPVGGITTTVVAEEEIVASSGRMSPGGTTRL
jgi:hypothetical protein